MSEITSPPYRTKRKQRSSKRKKRVGPCKCKTISTIATTDNDESVVVGIHLEEVATISDSKIMNVEAQEGENDEPTGNRIIDLGILGSVFSIISCP